MRNSILLVFTFLLLNSCRKESVTENCTKLKDAVAANNTEQVSKIITEYISNLPSDDYTAQNITKLTQNISNLCNITSGVYCFDCIKTLPSQTEIWVSFLSGEATIKKTIDITYTPANRMKFANMHE
jgi:hypothetical protein